MDKFGVINSDTPERDDQKSCGKTASKESAEYTEKTISDAAEGCQSGKCGCRRKQ